MFEGFTENKMALSRFTKNIILAFHIKLRERFRKSRFTATMAITIHEGN